MSTTKRLGERLVEAGLASADAVEKALSHQKITGHRLGDCLVELGLLKETDLLRFLAQQFNTRFVSTDKLSKVKIAPEILERVPVRMAEAQNFIPIALDAERKILSVVMAEPQNEGLAQEIALVTEMNEIFSYIALRSSIQAAIRKNYYGDPSAFETIGQSAVGSQTQRDMGPMLRSHEGSEVRGSSPSGILDRTNASRSSSRINQTQLRDMLGTVRGAISEGDFLESLNVLVSLIEQSREDFRGHSSQVARQTSLIGRRMGLTPREVAQATIAAYLHDLGKKPELHLTLPTLSMHADLRGEAKRLFRAPSKLFESVHLPPAVNTILGQLYEAVDGSGVPQGAKGDDIAAGARIIAVVDAFLDFTKNPTNSMNRLLSKEEALTLLRDQSGTLFDPVVVETLAALQSGDILKQRLENDGRQIVVADPDEATRTDLLDALSKAGVVVLSVQKLDAVVDALLANEADTLVIGLGFGVADLVALTQYVRARPECAALPLLVLGEPTDTANKEKLLQVGVTGFIPVPLNPDEAAVSIRNVYVERFENGGPGHQVRGNFDEISVAEVTRVLGAGKKSGRLTIRNGPLEASLHLERGHIVMAQCGDKKGELAITPAFAIPQADFQFDPDAILADMPNVDRDLDVLARQLQMQLEANPQF